MNVVVSYRNGVKMAYSLNAFNPWEGYVVSFNGTQGRIEHKCEESGLYQRGWLSARCIGHRRDLDAHLPALEARLRGGTVDREGWSWRWRCTAA